VTVRILHGDALEQLATLPDESVHSICTDPPYGLEFMGKEWDTFKTGRATEYSNGGSLTHTEFKNLGTLPSYVNRPAKRCAKCGKQSWSGSPCVCPEPAWIMDNSPLHSFQAFCEAWARECLRVLKPGGHLLSFGGSRTYHRMACAIEDAGFEIRDQIMWIYGSGFPKSLDVSKAIDKRGGVTAQFSDFRDAVRAAMRDRGVSRAALNAALDNFMLSHYLSNGSQPAIPNLRDFQIIRDVVGLGSSFDHLFLDEAERAVTQAATAELRTGDVISFDQRSSTERERRDIPATESARQWQGWGTALKPAHEPIVVARKPLIGTVAANVLKHGTGAINVDGCRVAGGMDDTAESWAKKGAGGKVGANGFAGQFSQGLKDAYARGEVPLPAGRWPANIIHDGSDEVLAGFPDLHGAGAERTKDVESQYFATSYHAPETRQMNRFGDSGSAARFFYTAKSSGDDRNVGSHSEGERNHHPTVKPTDLMQYLVRLVTPPGGTVLDPFAGSGSTGLAADREGFDAILIERDAEYVEIAKRRIAGDCPLFADLSLGLPLEIAA